MGDKWRVDGVTQGSLMVCGCDGGASGTQRWIVLCPLHAAAPDLLAALEQIANEQPLPNPDSVHQQAAARARMAGIARAAIGKAKG